jgi:hypothetical protein
MYFVLKYFQTNGKSKLEKGDAKMGRKLLEITTLNGLTIDELIDLVMVKLFCNTKYGFLSQISRLERC